MLVQITILAEYFKNKKVMDILKHTHYLFKMQLKSLSTHFISDLVICLDFQGLW
jgi:hypothetical protein